MQVMIGIVTASYNSEETITDTLDSIHSQTYQNFHHLVVDGLSSDNTINIVNQYSKKKCTVLSASDDGIYDAMNKGLLSSKGDVIGFLNSDDMYANEDALSKIATIFEDPNVDACYGDLVYVNYANTKILRYWRSGIFKYGKFSKGWCPPHPTFYVRRSIVKKYGLFNLKYNLAADAEYMIRLLEVNKINVEYIPRILVRMRVGGATSKNLTNILKQNLEIFSALRANNIAYSFPNFIVIKILSRCRQFFLRHNRYESE